MTDEQHQRERAFVLQRGVHADIGHRGARHHHGSRGQIERHADVPADQRAGDDTPGAGQHQIREAAQRDREPEPRVAARHADDPQFRQRSFGHERSPPTPADLCLTGRDDKCQSCPSEGPPRPGIPDRTRADPARDRDAAAAVSAGAALSDLRSGLDRDAVALDQGRAGRAHLRADGAHRAGGGEDRDRVRGRQVLQRTAASTGASCGRRSRRPTSSAMRGAPRPSPSRP